MSLRVFACYAREDLEIVRMLRSVNQTASVLRFEYDLEVLMSGEPWADAIRERIVRADLFQLFWSHAAADSREVEREWRFALSLRRKNFVKPAYWGPTVGPEPAPPLELEAIHFHRIVLP
jgi:hypothetical protein